MTALADETRPEATPVEDSSVDGTGAPTMATGAPSDTGIVSGDEPMVATVSPAVELHPDEAPAPAPTMAAGEARDSDVSPAAAATDAAAELSVVELNPDVSTAREPTMASDAGIEVAQFEDGAIRTDDAPGAVELSAPDAGVEIQVQDEPVVELEPAAVATMQPDVAHEAHLVQVDEATAPHDLAVEITGTDGALDEPVAEPTVALAEEPRSGDAADEPVASSVVEAPRDTAALIAWMGKTARAATTVLALAPPEQKNRALREGARALRAQRDVILAANARDLETASHLSDAMRDRLLLTEDRIEAMARGLVTVAGLPDPVGTVLAEWTRPNGLHIQRVRVPLGVIGIIYESRPNVTADAGALCLKAGNAAILRGGSESFHSNKAIASCLADGLRAAGLPATAIQLVPTTDRAAVGAMLASPDAIDVIVPRGGRSLVERVQRESRVPVFAHLEGINHVFVDAAADLDKARAIAMNAKMRRVSVCGAMETLLVDRAVVRTHLAPIVTDLLDAGCEVRGDETVRAIDERVVEASEQDWSTEYLEAILSVRVVDGLDDAIRHVNQYGSHHTDAIVTEDEGAAAEFLARIDSGIVLVNASTQFADGGEFGMGAEIGISTGKMHARGPVGAEQLTSYKYLVRGNGQVRP